MEGEKGGATVIGPVSTTQPQVEEGEKKKKRLTAGCWASRMLPSSGRICELQGQQSGRDSICTLPFPFPVSTSFSYF